MRKQRQKDLVILLLLLSLLLSPISSAFVPHRHESLMIRSKSTTSLNARPMMTDANLAVFIDKPLLSSSSYLSNHHQFTSTAAITTAALWKLCRQAATVIIIGFGIILLIRTIRTLLSRFQLSSSEGKRRRRRKPMEYDDSGWGQCTFRSKRQMTEKSNFIEYTFDLPQRNMEIMLKLGQQISLCYLDSSSNVFAQGNFFMYNQKKGTFSIVVPDLPKSDEMTKDQIKLLNLLSRLEKGEQVGVKPGPLKIVYHGKTDNKPITDIVYIANGTGIVPILNHVTTVLQSASSAVQRATVVWINEDNINNFQVMNRQLRDLSKRHEGKLLVYFLQKLDSSSEIIPPYQPQTMAVISGSRTIQEKGFDYLNQELGYPEYSICKA